MSSACIVWWKSHFLEISIQKNQEMHPQKKLRRLTQERRARQETMKKVSFVLRRSIILSTLGFFFLFVRILLSNFRNIVFF